jgi:hypothetical protein
MARMALAAWVSFGFFVVVTAGSAVFAGVRAWRLVKAFRAFTGAATSALDGVLERSSVAEEHALAATRAVERLTRALARLQESLARLAVLRAAAAEARAGLTSSLPTK